MRISLYILLISTIVLSSCGNDEAAASTGPASITSIQWIDSARNFGNITEGQKLAVSFRFKNTGDKPLIIQSVNPACGCTVADYPKEPIAPGVEGEITGAFDSNGREGLQRKHITVVTNTQPPAQDISFEVNVVARTKAAQNTPTN